MTEDQKDQTVTSNQYGKNQSSPTNQGSDQKQYNPSDEGSRNKKGDTSKGSSGTEEEQESTVEINEMEDSKHPHKQGVPTGSQEKSERSF